MLTGSCVRMNHVELQPSRQITGLFQSELPDPEICRAKAHTSEFADCLAKSSGLCPYILYFGVGCFCRHPQRKQIIARTLAANKSVLKQLAAS